MKTSDLIRLIKQEMESPVLNKQHYLVSKKGTFTFWARGASYQINQKIIDHLVDRGIIIAVKRPYGYFFINPKHSKFPCFSNDIVDERKAVKQPLKLKKLSKGTQAPPEKKSLKLSLF